MGAVVYASEGRFLEDLFTISCGAASGLGVRDDEYFIVNPAVTANAVI